MCLSKAVSGHWRFTHLLNNLFSSNNRCFHLPLTTPLSAHNPFVTISSARHHKNNSLKFCFQPKQVDPKHTRTHTHRQAQAQIMKLPNWV